MSISPAMITAKALGAMPGFALEEMGERRTLRLLSDVGLAEQFVEDRQGYIPEHALCEFVSGISQALGEDRLGLLFAPYLTVEDYGAWGQYVLSAPNLGIALLRAQQEMSLHSNTDRVEFVTCNNMVSYAYKFGHKHHACYPDLAYSAVAAMLSIPKAYLGQGWSPAKIEFDFPSDHDSSLAEETFGCPVQFNRPALRLVFPSAVLGAPRGSSSLTPETTRGDIVRERAPPPKTMLHSICAVVDMQVADRNVSLERLAQAMNIGPRSIQRKLSTSGTSFREVLMTARMKRACELLASQDSTVAGVAETLGYNEPGNFTRAFTTYFGKSPSHYLGQV
ncbi:AraC family transcriptional regulator [Shimia thalassica]|uniref:AraC family transcriptional regulator n=1 Tax=Shimia thalassica TaxID=1715693 RepID=UPI0026E1F3C9|nr:AraC family transcriptional regulator [Shimia thalassica]MDO6480858.1 AraC family transcriptional regulator ligand-binding domain-containing protein [Shimia thalassica]